MIHLIKGLTDYNQENQVNPINQGSDNKQRSMINKSVLPAHWEVKKLGEVVKTTSGGTPSRKDPNFYNGNIPWVKSGELNKGVITDTEEKITREAIQNSSAKIFPKGTLLIALYGATIGKLAFLGVEAATNQAVCGIFQNENIDSKFLFYYLFFSKPKLLKQSIGGAQPNISQGILKDLEIPLPPLSEQEELVAKLEELFSELDKGKEQLETARQQLKVYRQAVLKWAFEGRLNHDSCDLPDSHDSNSKGKNHDNQENPKNQGSDNLPEGWKWVKLGEISNVSGGLTKNSKRENFTLKLPFLRVANVYFNRLDLIDVHLVGINESEIERVRLHKHDLLFVEGNGSIDQIGRVALWDGSIESCVHQNHLIKSRLHNDVLPKYALHYFCSTVGRQRIKEQANSTSGLHTLNLTKISNLIIPLPSLEEQIQIVQEIESRLSVCDKVEETINQSLQQAETLRQSILKQAFEGKLVFNECNLFKS